MASKKSSVPPATAAEQQAVAAPEAASLTTSPEELKERFGAQRIPLAADFGALIDMADVGSRAVGMAKDQDGDPGPGDGLEIYNGRLVVKADLSRALTFTMAGVGVANGNGLEMNGNKIHAKANAQNAILVGTNGIGVNAGNGLEFSSQKLQIKSGPSNTISVNAAGVDLNDNAWEKMMAKAYGAQFIARGDYFTAFAANANLKPNYWHVYILRKNGAIPFISVGNYTKIGGSTVTQYFSGLTFTFPDRTTGTVLNEFVSPREIVEGTEITGAVALAWGADTLQVTSKFTSI